METTFKNIGLLFMSILVFLAWVLYHSFFRLFTSLHNSNINQYFHEIVLLLWAAVFIAQLIFARYKKVTILIILKNVSFVLAPLVVVTIYGIAKAQYQQDFATMTNSETIGRQMLCLPNMFAFGILCLLAMANKQKSFNYIRYIVSASSLLVGILLSHVFIVYVHFPFSMAVSLSFVIVVLALLTLMANDKIYNYTIKPYIYSLLVVLTTHLVWFVLANTLLQNTAAKFAQLLF